VTDGARHNGDAKIGQRFINIALGAIACLIAAGVLSHWGTQQAVKMTVNRFMDAMIDGDADVVQSLLATSLSDSDRDRLVPAPETNTTIISIVERDKKTRVRVRLENPDFKMYSNLTMYQDRDGQWRVTPHILNWWLETLLLKESTHSVMQRVITSFDKSRVDLQTADKPQAQVGYRVTGMRIDDSNHLGWVEIAIETDGTQMEMPLVFQLYNHKWRLIRIESLNEAPVVLQRALAETRALYDGERLADELQDALRDQKVDGAEVQRVKSPTLPPGAKLKTTKDIEPARP